MAHFSKKQVKILKIKKKSVIADLIRNLWFCFFVDSYKNHKFLIKCAIVTGIKVCLLTVLLNFFVFSSVFAAQVERMVYVMGTTLQIEVQAAQQDQAQVAAQQIVEEVVYWDNLLSNYKKDSEIFDLNQKLECSTVVKISPQLQEFLTVAFDYHQKTQGAFDVNIDALSRLWQLRSRRLDRWPSPTEIKDALQKSGSNKLWIKNDELFSSVQGCGIDTGGLGKGFALDKALQRAKTIDVEKVTLNFGGQTVFYSKELRQFKTIIRYPKGLPQFVSVDFPKSEISFSGSANGERFIDFYGQKIGHILNPKTGFPVDLKVVQVTVFSQSATHSDALSSALFVMAQERSLEWIDLWLLNFPLTGAEIVLEQDGNLQIWKSKLWKQWTKTL